MHIGIINCDRLSGPIQATYGDYPAMFKALFALEKANISWEVIHILDEALPEQATLCDAYVISGSRFGVLDHQPWIDNLIGFVQTLWQLRIKTLGICFGHQVMAAAMGGIVGPSPAGWRLGIASTHILKEKAWMKPFQSQFHICVSHQDQVLSLPRQAVCLGTTAHTPYAVLGYDNTFLSFQGHPEFDERYTRFLINKRKHLFDQATYQYFIDSLQSSPDNTIIAAWIGHFFG